MGLAASQARLLTITARLADNELKSQTINNAKMRLATQSSQASDEYISALNNAQLMFSNTDINGLARTQALTFNNLVSFSQYNNQYGLVNSAGLLLVSEQDAAIYERHRNDLEGFLGEYGLKWDTTFFDNPDGGSKDSTTILSQKLASFYGTGYNDVGTHNLGDFFDGMTNAELEELYLNAISQESSIERMNYEIYAKEYYNEVKDLYDNSVPAFRQQILGDSADPQQEEYIASAIAELYSDPDVCPPGLGEELVRQFLLNGKVIDPRSVSLNGDGTPNLSGARTIDLVYNGKTVASPTGNPYALNLIGSSLTASGREELRELINSLTDKTQGTENMSGFKNDEYTISSPQKITAITYDTTKKSTTTTLRNGYTDYNVPPSNSDIARTAGYDIDGTATSSKNDDISYRETTIDRDGIPSNGYLVTGIPGITLYLDVPVLEDATVTYESNIPNSDKDGWEVYSKDVQLFNRKWESKCEFDSSVVAYDDQAAIERWVSTLTVANFSSQSQIDATMKYFAEHFQGKIGADNDGKSGDSSSNPVNFKWDSDKDLLYSIPLHEITDTSNIPTGSDASRYATYKLLVGEYFNMLNSLDYFDVDAFVSQNGGNTYLQNYTTTKSNFTRYDTNPVAGTARGNGNLEQAVASHPSYLMNFVSMLEGVGSNIKSYGSDAFKSVLGTYLKDLMLDVLGEPKYVWVDENDPAATQNSDAKAQWYSNLFNRMQKGYKVLENGLANSAEWIEYAFESGLVTMEQVDKSFNWVSLDYKTCANIYEDSDTSDAVAKAEAKYNRAMNDIKQKDSIFDLQLKNIDTEHQSLQTEYDSVKGVMNKNIERTMKFDQSA